MAPKIRTVPMRRPTIVAFSHAQASYQNKEAAEPDGPYHVKPYDKPIVVLISPERYERLMNEGIDTSEH